MPSEERATGGCGAERRVSGLAKAEVTMELARGCGAEISQGLTEAPAETFDALLASDRLGDAVIRG